MSELQCDDPVYLNTRREALLIVGIWLACLCWVIPYCSMNGYTPLDAEHELKLVWGMPSWVFWGVAVPWFMASLASIVLCLFVIQDDDLGVSPEELAASTEAAQ